MPALANRKYEAFAQRYAVHLNARQAAIEAGYSEKTATQKGHNLSKREDVSARIDELRAGIAERAAVDADWIRERLKLEALGKGAETTTPSARVRALELLGRDVGLWQKDDEGGAGSGATAAPGNADGETASPARARELKVKRTIVRRKVTKADRER